MRMCSTSEDIYLKSHFDLGEHDFELRLNALNALVSNVCFRKENKQLPHSPKKKLIIQPRQPVIGYHVEFVYNGSPELAKPRSPSALKSPNSPSSGLKKSVRFADSIGLDLELIKTFINEAEEMADDDVDDDDDDDDNEPLSVSRRVRSFARNSPSAALSSFSERHLLKRFQAHSKQEVKRDVEARNVSIESVNSNGMCISGFAQVKNIAFEKQVRLRYSLDNWASYAESPCSFSFSNVADNHDFFCFSLCLPPDLPVGSSCEFCVRFVADNRDHWDNNNGKNYKFECCAGPQMRSGENPQGVSA